MLEQEKKEKNLKLWRIAVTVLMLLPMAEMLFVLPGLPDIIPVHWGVDGLARPLWQPVGAAAPRRDRAVSGNFVAARFLFPPAQGDAHRRTAHPGCL